MLRGESPIGVVLAGGRGVRMGGDKLTIQLKGRPLIEYPLAALKAVLDEVAVISKAGVRLPPLQGVVLWIEPDEPRHPLVGLVQALDLAGGRPILVCPADLPFVTPGLITRLIHTDPGGAPAVIAGHAGVAQPLLGCYQPVAGELLREAARKADEPVRRVIERIKPKVLNVEDPDELFNVNGPEDLLVAAGMLDQPKVKS